MERTLENQFEAFDGFKVHRLAKSHPGEEWTKGYGKHKRSEPLPVSGYVWISGRSGIAYYVTFAFAKDPDDAQIAIENYSKPISVGGRRASKKYGADQLLAFSDTHQVGAWGSVCVAVYSMAPREEKTDMPEVLAAIQKLLKERD